MRETPQAIDRSVKLLEYAAAFLAPTLLTIPVFELWALLIGAVVCGLAIKFTAGKSPGFMEEWLYKRGFNLPPLLPRKLKKLSR